MVTLPNESVRSAGMKKAVSSKFSRTFTASSAAPSAVSSTATPSDSTISRQPAAAFISVLLAAKNCLWGAGIAISVTHS